MEEHGDVRAGHAGYLGKLQALVRDDLPYDVETAVRASLSSTLFACSQHARLIQPGAATDAFLTAWQQGWANHMGMPPPPPSTSQQPSGAVAGQSGAEASEGGGQSSGRKRSAKGGHSKWMQEPDDAEWRTASPWVVHQADRRRVIKVRGDGGVFHELPPAATQELLQWYDHGRLLDIKKNVLADPVKGHYYDYRIEGGKYLTQSNPNHPESKPRECQILYAGEPWE
jgi:hypothetical protein